MRRQVILTKGKKSTTKCIECHKPSKGYVYCEIDELKFTKQTKETIIKPE